MKILFQWSTPSWNVLSVFSSCQGCVCAVNRYLHIHLIGLWHLYTINVMLILIFRIAISSTNVYTYVYHINIFATYIYSWTWTHSCRISIYILCSIAFTLPPNHILFNDATKFAVLTRCNTFFSPEWIRKWKYICTEQE